MSVIERFMLNGKKAVVTGGAMGIGQYVSLAFAEVGADVAVLDVVEAKDTVHGIQGMGRKAKAWEVSVTDEARISEAFQEIEEEFLGIDVVFNNAGICICKKAEEMTYAEWREVLDVNLNGQFLVARAAGKSMIRKGKGGSIINVASMSGHIVNFPQEQCAYNASKAGVIHLTKSLAAEWAKYSIRVNSISPGYVATQLSLRAPQQWKDVWYSRSPMPRMCKPEELQGVAVYLASEAAAFTTGSDILVDGGYTCF